MNKSESIGDIAKALASAQREMGNATKDAKNPFFKSTYADLNAIREAVLPVLNKHRISVLQPTVMIEGTAFVETVLLHESGEFISSVTEIIADKANNAQSAGSGISYARRYGLQSLVCVGAEDDDGEKAVGRVASKPTYTKQVQVEGSSPLHTVETTATIPTKSGGFGVKKEVAKPKVEESSEEGWE